jgi:hypothetical protein
MPFLHGFHIFRAREASVTVLIAFAVDVALSFGVDALTLPCTGRCRTTHACALLVASVLFLASVILAITCRPYFSAFLALVALLSAVSNAKYASLREPFVFADLSLFSQLFAHPRLYLPFLSIRAVITIAAGVAVVAFGFYLESTASAGWRVGGTVAALTCLAVGYALASRLPPTLAPLDDQRCHGFFAVFVAYMLNGMRLATFHRLERTLAASPFAEPSEPAGRSDVIVIQSESFFDARMVNPAIDPSTYAHFDMARHQSTAYGALEVPAWGANTMRSEFALLSGVPSEALGYARFYPYAFVRRAGVSLAHWYRRVGDSTLAIHPYYAAFLGRKRILSRDGIRMSIVLPGFVKTAMSDVFPGDKPFLWSADKAAQHIQRKLKSGREEIAFPSLLAFGMRLLPLLPAVMADTILGGLSYLPREER